MFNLNVRTTWKHLPRRGARVFDKWAEGRGSGSAARPDCAAVANDLLIRRRKAR